MTIKGVFLDSGAFSAYNKGVEIDIKAYAKYMKKEGDLYDICATLDVIGDYKGTERNQGYLEKQGLSPLMVFHKGQPYKLLKKYIKRYSSIALGGLVVDKDRQGLVKHLDTCWRIICSTPDGLPKVKVHGFGVTSLRILFRYPWDSVDSNSWALSAAHGEILVPLLSEGPDFRNGITITTASGLAAKSDPAHFYNLPKAYQRRVKEYLWSIGVAVGHSIFRKIRTTDIIKRGGNKRYLDKGGGVKVLEVIKRKGVINDYWSRRTVNVYFFYKVAETLGNMPTKDKMLFLRSVGTVL